MTFMRYIDIYNIGKGGPALFLFKILQSANDAFIFMCHVIKS